MGSAVSSPSGVWGFAPADKRLGAYWSQRVQLWWQQFLLIFLRTNVQIPKFVSEIQFLIGRRPTRSYSSWCNRHHCLMEVGAYGRFCCKFMEECKDDQHIFLGGGGGGFRTLFPSSSLQCL